MITLYYLGSKGSEMFRDLRSLKGVTLQGEWKHPSYKSNAGFENWVETLIAHGLTIDQAVVSLLVSRDKPGYDITWVLETHHDILKQVGRIWPFQERARLDLKYWVSHLSSKCSFEYYYYNQQWVDTGLPISLINRLKRVGYEVEDLHKLPSDPRAIKSLSDQRLKERLYPTAYKWVDLVPPRDREKLKMPEKWHTEIDPRYLNESVFFPNIDELLKAGMKPSSLLNQLSKKEANRAIKTLGHYTLNTMRNDYIQMYAIRELNNDPTELQEAESVLVYRWGLRNIEKLRGSREVHGPGGEVAVFHMHRILSMLKDEDLPKGEFTGWKKVMEVVEEKIQAEIDDQLKVDSPLPKFPVELGRKDITQLDTTHRLRDEGKMMDHCVGSYIRACRSGKTFLFHVDMGSPTIDDLGVTVEVGKGKEKGSYVIYQSKEKGNKVSPGGAAKVKEALEKKGMEVLVSSSL